MFLHNPNLILSGERSAKMLKPNAKGKILLGFKTMTNKTLESKTFISFSKT